MKHVSPGGARRAAKIGGWRAGVLGEKKKRKKKEKKEEKKKKRKKKDLVQHTTKCAHSDNWTLNS